MSAEADIWINGQHLTAVQSGVVRAAIARLLYDLADPGTRELLGAMAPGCAEAAAAVQGMIVGRPPTRSDIAGLEYPWLAPIRAPGPGEKP